ncbi:hypothetical protein HYX05_01250 [Candidatus Woesearchaeota archaeon]|nr:hypothetical protein [Candidatus Woesearchaeota archaeon]
MAKKDRKQYSQAKESDVPQAAAMESKELEAISKLPNDVQEKLKTIKTKLEKFQKKVLEKFDKYIVGIALMPPPKPEELQQLQQMQNPQLGEQPAPEPKPEDKDKIHVLVLVDDSDSRTMSKLELKDKLTAIISSIGTEIDPNITPQTLILSELWQNCFDAKYELLQLIALSAPIHDTGMLQFKAKPLNQATLMFGLSLTIQMSRR